MALENGHALFAQVGAPVGQSQSSFPPQHGNGIRELMTCTVKGEVKNTNMQNLANQMLHISITCP